MERSETIGELAKALSNAQKDISGARKDSANPFFKSKYADLASVQDAIKDALSSNNIAFTQFAGNEDEKVTCETMLMHSSGEWISSMLKMNPEKPTPAGIGSCLTYARRYGLSAICGVAQVDDDGNESSGNVTTPITKKPAAKPKAKPAVKAVTPPSAITQEQRVNYSRLLQETDTEESMLFEAKSITALDSSNIEMIINALKGKYAKMQAPITDGTATK